MLVTADECYFKKGVGHGSIALLRNFRLPDARQEGETKN